MNELNFTNDKISLSDWLMLSFTPKFGYQVLTKLIDHFGSLKEALNNNINTLSKVIPTSLAHNIAMRNNYSEEVNNSLLWLRQSKDRYIITLQDEIYPDYLRQISSPPLYLFAKGKIELLNNMKISIVGTRNPTSQGIENAKYFAYTLAKSGYTIVSGLAHGIDSYAHIGAIDTSASTIAVIGTGIDLYYPKQNKELQDKISQNGLLLSEFKLNTPPLANNFPRRNRIVVGISQACLVIESSIDGGSMISANLALDMGRDVMAVPGSIHNPMTKGCHKLIKNGAKLVESINDIIEELPLSNSQVNKSSDHVVDEFLGYLGYEAIHIDKICQLSKLTIADVCAKLLEYELCDMIVNCGNGYYQKIFK
jgi:DNA processing protein